MKIRNILLFIFFSSPAFVTFSDESSSKTLNKITYEIELLLQDDLLEAIKLANSVDKTIKEFPLEEQIRFKKLHAELFIKKAEYSLGKKAANEGIQLTKQLLKPSIIIAELLNLRGFAIESTGDFESAKQDYMAALEISESLNSRKTVINTLTNIGAIYYITEEFKRSLIVLNDALSLAQTLGDNKMLGLVNSELGVLYTYLKQEDKAKEFHEKAYKYLVLAEESHNALVSLQNIAINHSSNKRYEQAINLYKKIIIKAKKFDNFTTIANTYSVMAEAYLKRSPSDPHTAYHYILIAEKYLKSVEQAGIKITLLLNKADILNKLERYEEALIVIDEIERILPHQAEYLITFSSHELLRIKSELYYARGLYEHAYNAQKAFHDNTLQINARNNLQAIEGLRIEYESEQQEIQAKVLEKKQLVQSLELREANQTNKNRSLYILMGILFVLGLAWFYVINLKNQKKLLESRETDHLTDLPNRQTILPIGSLEFEKAIKANKNYSVLLVRVDNFKNINQVMGYDIGNNILIEISLIILNHLKKGIQCGRYSGTEFVVLLPKHDIHQAEKMANQIHEAVYNKSWDKYGLKVVSVSIGVAANNINYIDSFETLVKRASKLQHKAANAGGNIICV